MRYLYFLLFIGLVGCHPSWNNPNEDLVFAKSQAELDSFIGSPVSKVLEKYGNADNSNSEANLWDGSKYVEYFHLFYNSTYKTYHKVKFLLDENDIVGRVDIQQTGDGKPILREGFSQYHYEEGWEPK